MAIVEYIVRYFWPTNTIAAGIVIIMVSAFIFWIVMLYRSVSRLRLNSLYIDKASDISSLIEAREKRQIINETHKSEDETVFLEFCEVQHLDRFAAVLEHLYIIFRAGWHESRFEVGQLLSLTENKLFAVNNFLRSLLASFIILGLLGTLLGLADSLAHIGPMVNDLLRRNTEAMSSRGLAYFVTNLTSAFAPSIWGVSLSVFGLFLFTWYLRCECGPLRHKLEKISIEKWVPSLYPTTSQRLLETLQLSEEQMRRNFDTAKKVADLSDFLYKDINRFNTDLANASNSLQSVPNAVKGIEHAAQMIDDGFAAKLEGFSRTFSENTSRLTSFQEELSKLYKNMNVDSEIFQHTVEATLELHQKSFEKTHSVMKGYEDTYLTQRGKIVSKLQDFLKEASELNTSINARNREMLEKVQITLEGSLNSIRDTLATELNAISLRFGAIDIPIKSAAEKIEGTYENFYKQTEAMILELDKEIKRRDNDMRDQIHLLTEVKERIAKLLGTLSSGMEADRQETEKLTQNIGFLTSKIEQLSESTTNLSSSTGILGIHMNNMQEHTQKIASQVKGLAIYSDSISRLPGAIDDLANKLSMSQSISESTASISRLPSIIEDLSRNILVFNQSIRSIMVTTDLRYEEIPHDSSAIKKKRSDWGTKLRKLLKKKVF